MTLESPTNLVEGLLLLTRDLEGRQAMPPVSAPGDGAPHDLGGAGILIWKRE